MAARFIIFAHMRCGSTALTHALNEHPGLRVAMEPFHKKYAEWHPQSPDYSTLIRDRETAHFYADDLFARHNGMKVLDYHLKPECYEEMLLRDDVKVIRLSRRNQLQAIVSALIAQQTGVWHADEKRSGNVPRLQPLPLDVIGQQLEAARSLQRLYQGMIARKPPQARMDITYEELFTPDVDGNVERLCDVQDFLGVEPYVNDRVITLLTPGESKLNTDYAIVPNARQIEEAFGSEETGRLFDRVVKPASAARKIPVLSVP